MKKNINGIIVVSLFIILSIRPFFPARSQGVATAPSINVDSILASGLQKPIGIYNAGDGNSSLLSDNVKRVY